ncbi:hypothetical protein BDZ89DRAFT_1135074 [Hymenopellis radicata]|nr:hypothetical protein BDZ89DRAFT_1135074 [Hymenopellis radicata]
MFAPLAFFSLSLASAFAFPLSMRQVAIEGKHVGQATWFNASLGACGITNTDEDMIAAVTMGIYDAYPGATANSNDNPICKRFIQASYTDAETGQVNKVKVRVTDRCASVPDCQPPFTYNVDFTPAAFQKLAPLSLGRLDNLHWEFVGEGEEGDAGEAGDSDETDDTDEET